jgi:hypothetical protein
MATRQHNMDNNHQTTNIATNGGVKILYFLLGTLLKLGAQNKSTMIITPMEHGHSNIIP